MPAPAPVRRALAGEGTSLARLISVVMWVTVLVLVMGLSFSRREAAPAASLPVGELQAKGVGFESPTERIDTITATGELVFHLFASLAQFERNLIRERTRAGLVSARARGRKGGRPPKLGPKELREIRALLRDPDVTVSSIAKRYGVSRVTLYAHLNTPAKGKA